jgi:cell division protein FtsW (lipid II flippase)
MAHPQQRLVPVVMLFSFLVGLLVMLRTSPFDLYAAGFALLFPGITWLFAAGPLRRSVGDPLLFTLMNFLCGMSIPLLYSLSPSIGKFQGLVYLFGLPTLLIACVFVRKVRAWRGWCRFLMAAGIVFMLLPLLFRQATNGAYNWVRLPGMPFSFQPSELVKVFVVLVLTYYLARPNHGHTLTRQWPGIAFSGLCCVLLYFQQDLGTGMVYYCIILFLVYAATSSLPLTLAGLSAGVLAALLGYSRMAQVKTRVLMWQNPWSNANDTGRQLVQALIAIASGGLHGLGLGLGAPRSIPAYWTDFIFAVICEQFGIVFGLCVVAVYILIVLRGISIALRARTRHMALTALGVTVAIGIQAFIIIGGVIKLIPLTGITMPFVSYGGTSLLSCMALMGVLCGVAARNEQDLLDDQAMTTPPDPVEVTA